MMKLLITAPNLLLVMTFLLGPFIANAQTMGLKAESILVELSQKTQGGKDEVREVVAELTECSAYFSVFRTVLTNKPGNYSDAIAGLEVMERDTRIVAGLMWSPHSAFAAQDIDQIHLSAKSDIGERVSVTGTENVAFLQKYDECTQVYLFSQFMLGTAQEATTRN